MKMADGGFFTAAGIEWAHVHQPAITAYAPIEATWHALASNLIIAFGLARQKARANA